MTRRRAQRRLARYADDPLGPTWRDLDEPRYDGPAPNALHAQRIAQATPVYPPYEATRPAGPPEKDAAWKSDAMAGKRV